MVKLWDFLKPKIKKEEKRSSELSFLHEQVSLKSYDLISFQEWKETKCLPDIQRLISTSYSNFLITQNAKQASLSFLDTKVSSGLIIHCPITSFSKQDLMHVMYFFYLKFEEKGYVLNLADVKSRQKSSWVENIYRHYLKPSLRLEKLNGTNGPVLNQLYGNISIELVSRDDIPYQLKLLANNYHDQNYAPAQDFSDLIEWITKD